jgi:hypothetical protein
LSADCADAAKQASIMLLDSAATIFRNGYDIVVPLFPS